jgi:hypothetical protein
MQFVGDHDMGFKLKNDENKDQQSSDFHRTQPGQKQVSPVGHPEGTERRIGRRHKGDERRGGICNK